MKQALRKRLLLFHLQSCQTRNLTRRSHLVELKKVVSAMQMMVIRVLWQTKYRLQKTGSRKSRNLQSLTEGDHVHGVESVIVLGPMNAESVGRGHVSTRRSGRDLVIDLVNSQGPNPPVIHRREIAADEENTNVAGLRLESNITQELGELPGPVVVGHGPGIREDGVVQQIEVGINGKADPRRKIVAVEVSAKIAELLVTKTLREETITVVRSPEKCDGEAGHGPAI